MKRWQRMNTVAVPVIILLIIPFILCGRLDIEAKEWDGYVKNTSGEKDPWGDDYLYKIWTGNSWGYCGRYGTDDDDYLLHPIYLSYEVTYNYEEAYKMIDLVNRERRKVGAAEIKANDTLMQIAMERAAETAIYWAHRRPDGSAIEAKSMFIRGENIHVGFSSAKDANHSLVQSSGHYATMINPNWVYAGFGCVGNYWVQIFTDDINFYPVGTVKEAQNDSTRIDLSQMPLTRKRNQKSIYTAAVNPNYIRIDRVYLYNAASAECETIYKEGDILKVDCELQDSRDGWGKVTISANQLIITPQKNCKIKDNILTFPKSGKASFKVALKAAPQISKTITLKVQPFQLRIDTDIVQGPASSGYSGYRITSLKHREVSFIGNKEAKKVTIPDKIRIKGRDYRVTAIEENAFRGNMQLSQVIVGKNVRKIGRCAFYQCKGLKTIKIRSHSINKIGRKALTGISANAIIKVPKRKLSSYKKLFKGKGQGKTVQLKKY
ncbi:MAG: leucine-rich repeat protein [Bacteroidales bacterium]|nr:leucine-rich repeat protein [Clostridium sp.]MCM1204709.1 leucine-rich repeat protein [Bacteroidales bacterium]